MSPRVELAVTDEQRLDCMAIRLEVFVDEQGVPFVLEIDARDHDPAVLHLLAYEAERPIRGGGDGGASETGRGPALGTCRIIPNGEGRWHLGRIAVRRRARGRDIGAALVRASHEMIARLTPAGEHALVLLDAQFQAAGFYRKQGYRETSGEIFDDAGIPHIEMGLELPGRGEDAPGLLPG